MPPPSIPHMLTMTPFLQAEKGIERAHPAQHPPDLISLVSDVVVFSGRSGAKVMHARARVVILC